MSGFTMRRFVLQNITAVAAHCPIPSVAAVATALLSNTASDPLSSSGASASKASTSTANNTSASSPKATTFAQRLRRLLVSEDGGASAGSNAFSLVTPEELDWIRRRRQEDAQESRVVLSTRPTIAIWRGIGGCVLNLTLGCLLSPLVCLTVALEKVRTSHGVRGLFIGPLYGFGWSGVFFATAWYAALQQLVLSVYFSAVARPVNYCRNRRLYSTTADASEGGPSSQAASHLTPHRVYAVARVWSPLRCGFEAPCGREGVVHPLLPYFDSDVELRERAQKRASQRNKRDKRHAQYEGRKKRGEGGYGEGASAADDDDDYYGLLGVSKDATEREIKEAYNKLVLRIHPDRNPSPGAAAQFDKVTKAYRVIGNPVKRKKYDLGGTAGVEDLGAKKREAVRGVFGGEVLTRLSGDVFIGSFSQRVIDGLDYTADELAVLRQRMYERCRDELLHTYLPRYREGAATPKGAATASSSSLNRTSLTSDGPWDGLMANQLRKITATGLAKEVLLTIGQEYLRVVHYYDAQLAQKQPNGAEAITTTTTTTTTSATETTSTSGSAPSTVSIPLLAWRRTRRYCTDVAPHRARCRRQQMRHVSSVRGKTLKPEAMVDLAWYTAVPELELTARTTAMAVLYDPHLSTSTAQHRRNALEALGNLFVQYGQVYKGANKATMDQLMNSMREYQQQQQREKEK